MSFIIKRADGTEEEAEDFIGALRAGGLTPHQARQIIANVCKHDFIPFERHSQVIYACQHCRAIQPRS